MMNVVITLPRNLIDKILRGEKTYEMRKYIPYHYDRDCRIYVVQKRTKNIVLSFRCDYFFEYNPNRGWEVAGSMLGISKSYYLEYTKNAKSIWFWPILNLREENLTLDDIGVARAPQNFCYFNLL